MPWFIDNNHPDCDGWAVVKEDTGEVVPGGCHDSEDEAQAHLAALEISEEDADMAREQQPADWSDTLPSAHDGGQERRAGRVISRANEEKLRNAAQSIAEVLAQLDDEQNARSVLTGNETRVYDIEGVEIRADEDDNPIITGYAAVFNRLSVMIYGFREKIAPGAFRDTLNRDIRALWNHDSGMVLGRNKSGTLRLWEDDTGLGFELKPPDTSAGRDAVELIRRGDVSQMSFGFNVPPGGDEWMEDEDGMMIRTLNRVELMEVSAVAFPAYPDTSAVLRTAPEWVQRALAYPDVDDSETETADVGARARLNLLRMKLDVARQEI